MSNISETAAEDSKADGKDSSEETTGGSSSDTKTVVVHFDEK
jgi:hypothetical protein